MKAAFSAQRSALREAAVSSRCKAVKTPALCVRHAVFGRVRRGWLVPVGVVMAGWAGVAGAQGAAPSVPVPKALIPYTSCSFPDGLRIVSVEPLVQGVSSRPVQTVEGTQQIELEAGERVMFQYPLTDFFADAKVELLPADRYPELKAALLANLHFLESERGGPTPARALPVGLHGFEVHGNDRQKLEGNVVGMYVLFDDTTHVATTVYFLNQQTWQRKFQTMDEYGRLRDGFLRTYTGCVRENQAIEK